MAGACHVVLLSLVFVCSHFRCVVVSFFVCPSIHPSIHLESASGFDCQFSGRSVGRLVYRRALPSTGSSALLTDVSDDDDHETIGKLMSADDFIRVVTFTFTDKAF